MFSLILIQNICGHGGPVLKASDQGVAGPTFDPPTDPTVSISLIEYSSRTDRKYHVNWRVK